MKLWAITGLALAPAALAGCAAVASSAEPLAQRSPAASSVSPGFGASRSPDASAMAQTGGGSGSPSAAESDSLRPLPPAPTAWWPLGKGKTIYLTFDDGPWPETTAQVLDILRDNGARATFFQIGRHAESYGDINDRILAEGHAIGNHTYTHPNLNHLATDRIVYELRKTRRILGPGQGPCMRPPQGAATDSVRALAAREGMTPIFWTVDTRDWQPASTDSIAGQILSAKGGSIVLMHDGGGDRSRTVEALRRALPVLVKRGFHFELVPRCVASTP